MCIDFIPTVELLEQIGDITKYPFDASMITIENQLNGSVVFSVTQKVMDINATTAGFIAVHYQAGEETTDCASRSGADARKGETFKYTAICEHGEASVSIYLRNDGTTAEECDTCAAPTLPSAESVAYYLSIPCKPTCIQEEPDCYGGIMAMKKDTGNDTMCNYDQQPFYIERLRSTEVEFSFTNTWNCSMTDVTLFYDMAGGNVGPECKSLVSLGSGQKYPNILTAACNPLTKTAQIEVYVSSASIGYKGAKTQCGTPAVGACSYIYTVPCCESVVCDGDLRRLVAVIKEDRGLAASVSPDPERGFVTDEMRTAGAGDSYGDEEDDGAEDVPYCVHEDFPCQGDEESMVFVCHYSTRAGYQTFCIPETDSDIMRFYSNDYCGPCEGWNGVTHAGQAI